MKKNWKAIFSGCALAASLTGAALAAGSTRTETLHFNGISLQVNGETVAITDSTGAPTEPFIINGTTYLPVGNVAKLFGYEVKWDGSTQTVILELPEAQKPIYITQYGKKYHHDPHCNGGTYWEAPYKSAIGMGLEPCDKCIK